MTYSTIELLTFKICKLVSLEVSDIIRCKGGMCPLYCLFTSYSTLRCLYWLVNVCLLSMSYNNKKTTTPPPTLLSRRNAVAPMELQKASTMLTYRSWFAREKANRVYVGDTLSPLYQPLGRKALAKNKHVETSLKVARYHKGIDAMECIDCAPFSFEHCKSGPMVLSLNVVQEQFLLLCDSPRTVPWKTMTLQSGDQSERSWDAFESMLQLALINAKCFLTMPDMDWLLTQVENFSQIIRWSQKCANVDDYVCLTQLAYRLFTGNCFSVMVKDRVDALLKNEVQALGFGETLKVLRGAFDTTAQIQDSPLMKKLVSLYSFLLTQGFLKRFGMEISDEEYSKLEQRALVSAFSSKKAFFVCVLDNVLFICEKICEWRQTGDLSTFVHSSDEYAKWLREADRLLNLAPFVGNLSAHGTSYFSFLSNLKDTIEKGEAYAKYVRSTAGVDSVYIKRKLSSLQLLLNTEVTRRAAQQERPQPMGVLVYGSSSIAKSAFTKMLFNYYGGLFDLERDDQYRYVRNPMDEYWSNFDSSKWCIQLDDIAFLNPAKTSDVDSTLQDLLNVVNNVPYVPPQAALEDKGKTPVMAKLVVATTNCINLNAQEYFWCPLAIRRRLPFVVSVKPKQEYLHSNKVFIDPSKLSTEPGVFPDFWDITVSRIQPVMNGRREDANLEEVAVFSEVAAFLQFFGKACLEHEANQKKAMTKDNDMLTISVCKKCLRPLPHDDCIQLQHGVYSMFTDFCVWWLTWTIQWSWFMRLMEAMAYYRITRAFACTTMNSVSNSELSVRFFGALGNVHRDPRMKNMLLCVTALSAGFSAYYLFSRKNEKVVKAPIAKPVTPVADPLCSVEDMEFGMQGNVLGTTEDQLEKESASNVWYNPEVRLTTFDVPPSSASSAKATPDEVRDLFYRNCVMLRIKVVGDSVTRVMRGTFIRGQQCVTNGHAFRKDGDKYEIVIVQSGFGQGVGSNVTLTLSRSEICFDAKSDLCLFEVHCLPPFKDITTYWNNKEIFPSSGMELMRDVDGTVNKNMVYAVQYVAGVPVPELEGDFDIFFGSCTEITQEGMCGSIFIALTPRGPIVVGIHMLGTNHHVGFLRVTLSQIEALAQNSMTLRRPIVQGGGMPMLSSKSKTNVLTAPHHRSLFRYLETGSLNLYGTFAGFRAKPRSKVCATPLQTEFLEHFGTEVQYGQPAMSGWEPWRRNIVEMVKPNSNYDKTILHKCVEGFTANILAELPKGWEGELVILSDKAAVNGLPSVKYIDKLATNTSMGFPWACTKKKYLVSDICEKYPDGVNFEDEVWERVRAIEALYLEGKRAFPVFTGHLKDEATPIPKCRVKKTRMFAGGPVDWSIAVRKRMLPFVRLLQKNKFVFEAGPGTVAQSAEWGMVHDYLVAFGDGRIIAGDYGKFDKRMLSDFILAAFDVIVEIYRAAGFDETDCRVLMCIANDIAFPVTSVNGDLVEFFGTNPSGHPLTVIINSLVNSLYMRYCYFSLNPESEVRSFKKNVHLFTYGDDNVMGVSPACDWFNHTAVQTVLADIGVEYTMADKESESVPFIRLYDCSFLKRKWVWSEDVSNWVCPLEEASIIKSLTMWVPSDSIDCYHQMVAVISSANSEYFFYGREVHKEKREFFQKLLEREPFSFYVTETTLPNFDQLVERFQRASEAL